MLRLRRMSPAGQNGKSTPAPLRVQFTPESGRRSRGQRYERRQARKNLNEITPSHGSPTQYGIIVAQKEVASQVCFGSQSQMTVGVCYVRFSPNAVLAIRPSPVR